MKLLKILGGDDYGGQYVCECQFIEHWKRQGIQVDAVIIGKGRAFEKYISLVDKYFEFPEMNAQYSGSLINRIKGIINSFTYLNKVKREIKHVTNYDAVIYRGQIYIWLASYISKKSNCRAYWHLPNAINVNAAKLYFRFALKREKIIPIANSEFTKQSVGDLCNHIVYPGFDSRRVEKRTYTLRDELRISETAKVIGSAARIEPNKAQDLIIHSFIKSGLIKNNWHLIIAGIIEDKEFFEYCTEISKSYSENIHFVGMIEDMPKFYSGIDVFFNGRRDAEPFGISIAEALGGGIPVIAYYKGGPSEMIVNNHNGWLIEEPNIDSYTESISHLNTAELGLMGKRAKEGSKRFRYEYNADQLISIINEQNNCI